jgi:site-specific recombinase XerC
MHPALEAYVSHLSLVQRSTLTVRRYRDVLRELDRFTTGAEPGNLTTDALVRFVGRACLDGRPRAPAGVNLRVAVLKSAFRHLHAGGVVQANPAVRLTGVREPRRAPKHLATAEIVRLLRYVTRRRSVNRARDLAVVITFWQTGLRVSELARLTWSQLDVERRCLGDVLVKGGHRRDVPLNDQVLAVLRAYRATRVLNGEDTPIFARRDGHGFSVRAIQALFTTWRVELEWTRPLHPHVLRHTHATDALALGADVATVADLLGHRDLLLTAS